MKRPADSLPPDQGIRLSAEIYKLHNSGGNYNEIWDLQCVLGKRVGLRL